MTSPRRSSRVVAGLLAAAAVCWGASLVAVLWWSRHDAATPSDAIVVLGAAQYVGRPSPVLKARLDHAVELWRKGLAPLMVLTGGTGAGDTTSEAAVSRRYVMRRGVPDSAIDVEHEGRTTRQSIDAVAGIMRASNLRSAILVSDPFHMLRLRILASAAGLDPHTSPTRTSPISANRGEQLGYILSESFKVPLTLILTTLER